MCVFVLLLNLFFFLRSGYLDRETVYKWYRSRDVKTQERLAISEEQRRKSETLQYRVAALGSMGTGNKNGCDFVDSPLKHS